MNIIYISNSRIPSHTANSIQVMKMCAAFSKKGHEVMLLAPSGKDPYLGDVKDIYEFYGVDKSFKIKELTSLNHSKRSLRRIFSLVYTLSCVFFTLKTDPDIVYGRVLSPLLILGVIGKKIVYEIHMVPADAVKWKVLDLLTNVRGFKHLVVISDKLKVALKKKLKTQKIVVAHDGAEEPDKKKYDPVEKKYFEESGSRKRIGYTGQLYAGKGGEIIVDLAVRIKDMDFHVFGGLEEDIFRLKERASENVFFHGFVENCNIPSILSELDILLLPAQKQVSSYNDKETLFNIAEYMSPMKMFEYMASGKPIISSDLPVLKEVLKNMENAILCDPDNIDEWISAVRLLIEDEYLAKKIGERAKKEFEKRYTWLIRSERVLECGF